MNLFSLTLTLTLFQITSSQTNQYGDGFSSYYGYNWSSTILNCNDLTACTVNCWGGGSCHGVTISGPINASLTINCDSQFGGGGANGVGTCQQMNVYAGNSTTLTINVYNEDYGFFSNLIYTPNSNNASSIANTFITCGLIEDIHPSTPTAYSCGQQNEIYSLNGWQTVEWSYAGTASWSLNHTDPSFPNNMHCGKDYLELCSGFVVDGFYYRCNEASVCDYDRSSEPQYHPRDLSSVYSNNITLSSSMTFNVVTAVQISQNVFFNVPGDTVIVFKGDYTISVFGTINIGCDAIDTINSHDIGIISESESVSIYNEDNSTRQGTIHIHDTGSAFFCNTRFTNLVSIYYHGWDLFVDNCEFDNIGVAIRFNTECGFNNQLQHVTDNKFMNCYEGIKNAICVNIENNIFESVYSPISCTYGNTTINNNTFGSAGYNGFHAVTPCDAIHANYDSRLNITLNTFINWQHAIHIENDEVNIFYNEFIENTQAIYITGDYYGSGIQINYNNFINNSYSIYYSDCGADTIGSDNCKQPYCGYNYYGTSSINQSIISSQIYDLCVGGDGYGLVTWWPWYTEPIDFNSLPTTLQEHTFDIIQCVGADTHPEITGNKLAPIYTHDTTLTSFHSPYYIVGYVRVTLDATLYVESGVQLIFAGKYYEIDIDGALIMGCSTINTVNNHTVGIISNAELIYVSSINSMQMGIITIRQWGSGSFCNTKFENMLYPISRAYTATSEWHRSTLFIDNCEFYNNTAGIVMTGDSENDYVSNQITDSKFQYNSHGAVYNAYSINISNNIFQNTADQTAIRNMQSNVHLFGNTFIYDNFRKNDNSTAIAVHLSSPGYISSTLYKCECRINVTISFNTFYKWPTAIFASFDYYGPDWPLSIMVVNYNEFVENSIAIDLQTVNQQRINYNNFIENGYNIRSMSNENQTYCNYNWNGYVNNISHPSLTAAKIYDGCDTDYYDGIVTFWPYFDQALDLTKLTHFPEFYTLDFTNCSSMNETIAYYHSGGTSHPFIEPTTHPTKSPDDHSGVTSHPTAHPTKSPDDHSGGTSHPTAHPTKSPDDHSGGTSHPFIEPTTNPTKSPDTQATGLVPTILFTKVSTDGVCSLSMTISILFIILLEIIF
eukprot:813884_1